MNIKKIKLLNHEKMCIKSEVEEMFYTPPQKRESGRVLCYTSEPFECPSVRPFYFPFVSGLYLE